MAWLRVSRSTLRNLFLLDTLLRSRNISHWGGILRDPTCLRKPKYIYSKEGSGPQATQASLVSHKIPFCLTGHQIRISKGIGQSSRPEHQLAGRVYISRERPLPELVLHREPTTGQAYSRSNLDIKSFGSFPKNFPSHHNE